jgi:hypothetical protein
LTVAAIVFAKMLYVEDSLGDETAKDATATPGNDVTAGSRGGP